jgi:hypothetical protein
MTRADYRIATLPSRGECAIYRRHVPECFQWSRRSACARLFGIRALLQRTVLRHCIEPTMAHGIRPQSTARGRRCLQIHGAGYPRHRRPIERDFYRRTRVWPWERDPIQVRTNGHFHQHETGSRHPERSPGETGRPGMRRRLSALRDAGDRNVVQDSALCGAPNLPMPDAT